MTWEQRHNVYLPEDMKRLYLSTDGFSLIWSYQYSRKQDQHQHEFNQYTPLFFPSQRCATRGLL